jgi:sugar lactone lactonase YvrE
MLASLLSRKPANQQTKPSGHPSRKEKHRTRLQLETLEERSLLSPIFTIAGKGTGAFSGDGGAAIRAEMDQPSGITADSKGRIFFVDDYNERVRKISPSRNINTFAGNGMVGDFGDNGPARNASFQFGTGGGVAADALGNVYIACPTKSRVRVVTPDGVIKPFAGSFINQGNSGDGGRALDAELMNPYDVAVDAQGNVYIADAGAHTIREVTTDGIIHTVAGTGERGFSGDGGLAIRAQLNSPTDIEVDAQGNLYILDSGNERVRKVTTDGKIQTLAGNGRAGFSGDNGLATQASLNFQRQGGLAVDALGAVYVADTGNHRIRKITPRGNIKTIAGTGVAGFSGDGAEATRAKLNNPTGLTVNALGDLFISDTFNNRIRMIPHS